MSGHVLESSAALFWAHRPVLAFAIGFAPSVVVSAALVRYANLESYRQTAFGQYLQRLMTRRVELARLAGLVPLWDRACLHSPTLIAVGIAWILACWLFGTTSR